MPVNSVQTAQLHTFDELPVDRPMPLISRRRVIGEHMMVSDVRLDRGFTLASHEHPNEQFIVLLSGRCRFGVGREGTPAHRVVEVAAGQVLVVPPNEPHSCVAIEDTHILDLFSPPSAMTGIDRR